MIKVNRILVHCENEQCTLQSKEDITALRARLAEELKIPAQQITFTYEETNTQVNEKN